MKNVRFIIKYDNKEHSFQFIKKGIFRLVEKKYIKRGDIEKRERAIKLKYIFALVILFKVKCKTVFYI